MKLEPLKNKEAIVPSSMDDDYYYQEPIYKIINPKDVDTLTEGLFFKKDVTSAVQWLKEQLLEMNKYHFNPKAGSERINKIISDSFPDVCESGEVKHD